MRYLLAAITLTLVLTPSVFAQHHFNPETRTGNLGSVDPGAIMSSYTDPAVPNTYEFIDPKTVGLPDEDPKDVINVEKMDVHGVIKINPEDAPEDNNK